ncbi:hypothetical protein [Acinetobacter larvae]|uniref:Uncharacterized protein n=1 Tax=Acinetobacter larvae TaxID=1789224 RepID=A0A1B2LY64_9GAMM|nr:hypothetical protein [Acinetobacter larvae]AOA57881.1 hypothetical protein BFG52_05625 [Acinetobacter larvae]
MSIINENCREKLREALPPDHILIAKHELQNLYKKLSEYELLIQKYQQEREYFLSLIDEKIMK